MDINTDGFSVVIQLFDEIVPFYNLNHYTCKYSSVPNSILPLYLKKPLDVEIGLTLGNFLSSPPSAVDRVFLGRIGLYVLQAELNSCELIKHALQKNNMDIEDAK